MHCNGASWGLITFATNCTYRSEEAERLSARSASQYEVRPLECSCILALGISVGPSLTDIENMLQASISASTTHTSSGNRSGRTKSNQIQLFSKKQRWRQPDQWERHVLLSQAKPSGPTATTLQRARWHVAHCRSLHSSCSARGTDDIAGAMEAAQSLPPKDLQNLIIEQVLLEHLRCTVYFNSHR